LVDEGIELGKFACGDEAEVAIGDGDAVFSSQDAENGDAEGF
jgi:hypothetical protein